MNRILGIVSAMLLSFVIFVPVAAAADPQDEDEHFLFNTGGDITLPADQQADLLVVVDGIATIEGDANAVLVINGTANFVGSRTTAIVAIGSQVTLDPASVVAGDIRTVNSTVESATGAVIEGDVADLGPDLVGAPILLGTALFLVYLAFVVSAIAAGLILARLAARQVREAGALIRREPVAIVVAGLAGLIGIVLAGVVAIVTVFGAPLGLGLLLFVLPLLIVVGYLVVGIWIGELIVGRVSPRVRERPYLAALLGLALLGAVSILPGVGGLISIVGVGAVVLLGWRAMRRDTGSVESKPIPAPSIA